MSMWKRIYLELFKDVITYLKKRVQVFLYVHELASSDISENSQTLVRL
jgi:hypothetical protein